MNCNRCQKEHNGTFGTGKFCSRSCANKRDHSFKTRMKIKASVKLALNERTDEEKEVHRQNHLQNCFRGKRIKSVIRESIVDTLDWSELFFREQKDRVLKDQNGKCLWCGINTWRNLPIVLELDHIDGNKHNNTRENLRFLCLNCHSQTPTFRKTKRQIDKLKQVI